MKGVLLAICRSERKGEPKRPVARGVLAENHGLEGDAHAGAWHRQVSLLACADIEEMRARGLPDLQPGAFGENLIVDHLDLARLGPGSRLRIGQNAVLSITQRGKACHNRCEIYYTVGDCIMPRVGLFARVLEGGEIAVGDPVEVVECVSRERFQAVVLTISDRGAAGERVDTAGPAVAEALESGLSAHIYCTEILPDDRDTISARLKHYSDGHGIDLIVAVGGTGFSPRDSTPEAVRDVVERLTPGLDEAMRAASFGKTPHAVLSRGVSGIRGQTLILSLPGSKTGALENLEAILPALPHGLAKLRGDRSDCAVEASTSPVQATGQADQ